MANNIEEYLAKALEQSITEHVLCTRRARDGRLVFYIHPLLRDGETLDFSVQGDTLTRLPNPLPA
jgi:hypothetical protein